MSETMNMIELSIDKVIDLIREDMEDENYDPVLILGKSGVGKTESVYELTKELGIGFCELRLVNMTEVDLLGIPVQDEYGATTYASNTLLPRVERDGEYGILVLDEITSAERTVRAAAYQLLDSKRALGNYKLPDGWKCVAIGNGIGDGGVFQGMEAAFINRASGCYRVAPDYEAWKRWAIKNGVNPQIIAFLGMRPELIHKFYDEDLAAVFPSPRSWTALSKKLNAREKRCGILPSDMVEIYAAGAIGIEAAAMFSAFYSYSKKVISVDDILRGTASTDIAGIESEAMYITSQSLISAICKELKSNKVNGRVCSDAFDKLCNAIEWVSRVGIQVKDYGLIVIRDISAASAEFREIMVNGETYGEMSRRCPTLSRFMREVQSII